MERERVISFHSGEGGQNGVPVVRLKPTAIFKMNFVLFFPAMLYYCTITYLFHPTLFAIMMYLETVADIILHEAFGIVYPFTQSPRYGFCNWMLFSIVMEVILGSQRYWMITQGDIIFILKVLIFRIQYQKKRRGMDVFRNSTLF